jgi:hypothetical protein
VVWKKFCSDYTNTVERLRRLLNATEQQHGGDHRFRRVEIAHVYEIFQLPGIESHRVYSIQYKLCLE